MGLVLSSDSMDFFFLRLFELGGEKDVKTFDYRKIVEEWGQDDDRVANQLKSISNISNFQNKEKEIPNNHRSKIQFNQKKISLQVNLINNLEIHLKPKNKLYSNVLLMISNDYLNQI